VAFDPLVADSDFDLNPDETENGLVPVAPHRVQMCREYLGCFQSLKPIRDDRTAHFTHVTLDSVDCWHFVLSKAELPTQLWLGGLFG
jgi:hypothetical protein